MLTIFIIQINFLCPIYMKASLLAAKNTSPHFPSQGYRRHIRSSVSSYATCVHGSLAQDKIYTVTHYIFMGVFVQEILTIRNAARRLRQSSPIFLPFFFLLLIPNVFLFILPFSSSHSFYIYPSLMAKSGKSYFASDYHRPLPPALSLRSDQYSCKLVRGKRDVNVAPLPKLYYL